MTPYPADLPVLETRNVINIARSGEIASKKAEFAHDLWVVQGYAQSRLLGETSFNLSSQSAPETCCGGNCTSAQSVCDPLAEMEKVLAQAEGISAQALIDWKAILKFAAEKLLEYLLTQAL